MQEAVTALKVGRLSKTNSEENMLKNKGIRTIFTALMAIALMLAIISTSHPVFASTSQAPKPTKTNTPPPGPSPTPAPPPIGNIIPMPVSSVSTGGSFTLPGTADIYVNPGTTENLAIGQYLANKLNPSTGYGLTVIGTTTTPANGNIYLKIGTDSTLGAEGYLLTVTTTLVTLEAYQPAGLFRGLQTIRQMLPATIEKSTVQSGPFTMTTGTVRDYPRFAYRGSMQDVARHFFTVAELQRQIDNIAYYKMNYFHIHLADDQGWRIVINGWPNLTDWGSGTEVDIAGRTGDESCTVANDGGPCYYTQAQYTAIVNYAAARYITIVPEIDMPGHINAALASYASLNCNGIAPARYTGTNVGFSSLCTSVPSSYTAFVNAVIDQLSALTPGPFFDVGGDESAATPPAEYLTFVSQVQARVIADGKRMMGWEEVAQIADFSSTSVAQHWNTTNSFAPTAVQKGAKVIMSPCPRAYMDIMYGTGPSNPSGLGLHWCGYDSVQNSYSWDPGTYVPGVPEASVLGVEGPLWAETVMTTSDIDQMDWPRLAGLAELGWSPVAGRNWTEYKVRMGSHGPRLTNMGINFWHSSEIPWQ
jgi:hexosaminidase